MTILELSGDTSGSLSLRYGMDSRCVLIEVRGVLLASAGRLRMLARFPRCR